jgi:hypothetical protein
MPTFPVLRAKLEPLFDLRTVVRRPAAPFDPWEMVAQDRMSGALHDIVVCLVKGRSDPLGAAERRIDVLLRVCQGAGQRLFVPIDDAYVAAVGTSRTQGTSVLITPHEPRFASSIADVMAVKSSAGVAAPDALAFFKVVADTIIGGLVTMHRHGVPHAALAPAAVRLPRCDSLHETMLVVASTHQCRLGGIAVGTLLHGATPAADWRAAEELLIGLAASTVLAHVSSRCISYSLEALAAARAVKQDASETAQAAPDVLQHADDCEALPSAAVPSAIASRGPDTPSGCSSQEPPRENETLPEGPSTSAASSDDSQATQSSAGPADAAPRLEPNRPSLSPARGGSAGGSTSTRTEGSTARVSRASSSTTTEHTPSTRVSFGETAVEDVAVDVTREVPDGHGMDSQSASPRIGWSPDEACSPDPFTLRLLRMVDDITAMSPARTAPRRATPAFDERSCGRIREHEIIGQQQESLASLPLSPAAPRFELRTSPARDGVHVHDVLVPRAAATNKAAVGGWQSAQPRSGVLDFVARYVSPSRSRDADNSEPSSPARVPSAGQDQSAVEHNAAAACAVTPDAPNSNVAKAGCCVVM